MYKNRKKRTIIIGSLLAILICMTIGYAAFQTQLNIVGSSVITSNWDVQIINISLGTPTGTGENAIVHLKNPFIFFYCITKGDAAASLILKSSAASPLKYHLLSLFFKI